MKIRHLNASACGLLAGLLCVSGATNAQSIEDKLRSQLRSTTQALRQLQDGQAQLQADKAAAEQQRDKALGDLKAAQAKRDAAQGQSGAQASAERALSAEKASHAEDARQLAKYRASYEALQAASRARDTEQSQAQAALRQRDTQLQTCQEKNAQLYQVGHDILDAYEHVGIGTVLASKQPFAQGARVRYDGIAQRYGDQLYAGKYDPAARTAAPAAAASAAPAAR
ncbi:hypothetical protein [Burkholderia alba]|uniref:hypothetical protein n=1 Tax=Burkholderia alba TaxID=2683677 RepID=UPI002B05D606|nr:hypothetical protein [Burkholderia alba]